MVMEPIVMRKVLGEYHNEKNMHNKFWKSNFVNKNRIDEIDIKSLNPVTKISSCFAVVAFFSFVHQNKYF